MPDPPNHGAAQCIRVELIEADVDLAFSLMDDAREEFHEGNMEFAHAALEDANQVVRDIEERLAKLDAEHRAPFELLVEELRRTIRAAEAELT